VGFTGQNDAREILVDNSASDNLSVVEDGDFIWTPRLAVTGNENSNNVESPIAQTMFSFWLRNDASFTDGSVNTFTLRVNDSDTAVVLTIPNLSTGLNVLTDFEELMPALQPKVWKFNSDSVGVGNMRNYGWRCRF